MRLTARFRFGTVEWSANADRPETGGVINRPGSRAGTGVSIPPVDLWSGLADAPLMAPASSDTPPSELPVEPSESAGSSATTFKVEFDWVAVISLVHPLKVAIIEALHYIGRPMSASEFTKLFDGESKGLSSVSYHVRALAQDNVIEKVAEREGLRGPKEKFYFFR
jgi:DNA-binding transcriptional ArsR family regulator